MSEWIGFSLAAPDKPPLALAFQRARDFLKAVDQPTRREIFAVYRACVSGGTIFFRCSFSGGRWS